MYYPPLPCDVNYAQCISQAFDYVAQVPASASLLLRVIENFQGLWHKAFCDLYFHVSDSLYYASYGLPVYFTFRRIASSMGVWDCAMLANDLRSAMATFRWIIGGNY